MFRTIIYVGTYTLQHSPYVLDTTTTEAYNSKILTSTDNGSADCLTVARPCSGGLVPNAQFVGARRAGARPVGTLSPRRGNQSSFCVCPASWGGSGGRPLAHTLPRCLLHHAFLFVSTLTHTFTFFIFFTHSFYHRFIDIQRFVPLVTLLAKVRVSSPAVVFACSIAH